MKFGELLVVERTTNPNNKRRRAFWLCNCSCGNTSIVSATDLTSGKTNQCQECAFKLIGRKRRKDLVGQRFGKLVVTKMIYGQIERNNRQRTFCECICDCGNIITRKVDNLQRKTKIKSCGCAAKEIADGLSKDVLGQKFGMLTVTKELKELTPRKVLCLCECGNEVTRLKTDVTTCHTQSCGCLHKKNTSLANEKDWTNKISDYNVKALKQEYKNKAGQWVWSFECPLCNNIFIALPAKVFSGHTTSCGCRIQSRGEYFIEQLLNDKGIDFKTQFSFPNCKDKKELRFDFAILNNGEVFCLIEYDGKQHYECIDFFGGEAGFQDAKRRDAIKDEYCRANNIPLIRIKYDLKEDEIKEIIANIKNP